VSSKNRHLAVIPLNLPRGTPPLIDDNHPTPLGKPLPNALRVQFPQGIPDRATRVTSNRTSREVAGAVQRGHIDADRRVQFACRARVGSRILSVLIVTRGEEPVDQGSETCASFTRMSSVHTDRSGAW
jgi:hypothetical protein